MIGNSGSSGCSAYWSSHAWFTARWAGVPAVLAGAFMAWTRLSGKLSTVKTFWRRCPREQRAHDGPSSHTACRGPRPQSEFGQAGFVQTQEVEGRRLRHRDDHVVPRGKAGLAAATGWAHRRFAQTKSTLAEFERAMRPIHRNGRGEGHRPEFPHSPACWP